MVKNTYPARFFRWNKQHWPVVMAAACLLVSLIQLNRALSLGYLASILFYCTFFIKTKRPALLYWAGGMMFILLLVTLTFFVKTGSSEGRMLIYKISWSIFKDHYESGIGLGKFQLHYGLYQASYFERGDFTQKELLLAGNTYYAFNDYFQWVIETGVSGILLLAAFFLYVVHCLKMTARMPRPLPPLLLVACTQLIAILCAAFFTHLFEKVFYQCLLAFCLLTISYYCYVRKLPVSYYLFFLLISCGSLMAIDKWVYISSHGAIREWRAAKQLAKIGNRNQAIISYANAYKTLHNSPAFLKEHASYLIAGEKYLLAIPLLEKAIKLRTENELYTKLAFCYNRTGNTPMAEKYYIQSINIVPNRFVPRYALFSLYRETSQTQRAIDCGRKILSLPVKVPSITVQHIQTSVHVQLRNYSAAQ